MYIGSSLFALTVYLVNVRSYCEVEESETGSLSCAQNVDVSEVSDLGKFETVYIGVESGILKPSLFKALNELPNVVSLYVTDYKLTRIEKGTFSDLNISTLSLSSSGISNIEDSTLNGLQILKELELDNNEFETILVHRIIEYPAVLQTLSLRNNSIKVLSKLMLKNLNNLQDLILPNNKIERIESEVFQQTPELDLLDLNGNRLKEIHTNIFPAGGSELTKLFLVNNQLMFLPPDFFVRLKNLETVGLVGNPWYCTCLNAINILLHKKKIKEYNGCGFASGPKPICVTNATISSCPYTYNSDLSRYYLTTMENTISDNTKLSC